MPYDALLMFSDKQTFTATAISTNVLDFGLPSINPRTWAVIKTNHGGVDHPIVIKVGAAFTGLTSIQVNLQTSADDTTYTTVMSTAAIPVATLVAGYEFGFVTLPLQVPQRYMRLQYVVVGTGVLGDITAGFADGFQTNGVL